MKVRCSNENINRVNFEDLSKKGQQKAPVAREFGRELTNTADSENNLEAAVLQKQLASL